MEAANDNMQQQSDDLFFLIATLFAFWVLTIITMLGMWEFLTRFPDSSMAVGAFLDHLFSWRM